MKTYRVAIGYYHWLVGPMFLSMAERPQMVLRQCVPCGLTLLRQSNPVRHHSIRRRMRHEIRVTSPLSLMSTIEGTRDDASYKSCWTDVDRSTGGRSCILGCVTSISRGVVSAPLAILSVGFKSSIHQACRSKWNLKARAA